MISLSTLEQNLRVALRSLRRQPMFLATSVLSLAIAIGLNTTVYSMLDAMLNPRIAGAHPERLYTIRYFGDVRHVLPAGAVTEALRDGLRSYQAVSGYKAATAAATVARGDFARDVRPIYVRSDFFQVAGVAPIDGRFIPNADASGATPAVISDRLRNELFAGDASPIGASITLDGRVLKVAAVARRYSTFDALDTDLWVIESGDREAALPVDLIRMRAGFDPGSMNRELSVLAGRLALDAGESPKDTRFYFKPIARQFRVSGIHLALIAMVVAVLLVACANLSNLQLARGLDRGRELAIRASLGASRRALVGLLVSESVVITVVGVILGLLFAAWGSHLLVAAIPENSAGYVVAPEVSWRMPVAAMVAGIVCVCLVGLLPAIRLSRVDLHSLMKSGAGTGAHRGHRLRYGLLLAAQIAFTLPLVAAAVQLARSAYTIADRTFRTTELYGFDGDSVVAAHLTYPIRKGTYVHLASITNELLARARSIRNVSTASVVFAAQPDSSLISVTDANGTTTVFPVPMWSYLVASPDYYRAMGLPVENGSDFLDGVYAAPTVIVDRPTSTYLWPHGGAVGQRIKFGGPRSNAPWLRVVGVRGDHLSPKARLYRAWFDTLRVEEIARTIAADDSVMAGAHGLRADLYVRATSNPHAIVGALREALSALTPGNVPQVQWERDQYGISDAMAKADFMSAIFSGAAAVCLALAAFGVFAIVAQSVAQRRREFAVRISLGATPRGVLALILREGNVYVLAGVAMGLILTVETLGWLPASYFDLSATSIGTAFTMTCVCAFVFAFAAVAALVPALRATTINPVDALRSD